MTDRITIQVAGHEPVEVTPAGLERAAAVMELETATKGSKRMGTAETMMPGADKFKDNVRTLRAGAARAAAMREDAAQTDVEAVAPNPGMEERTERAAAEAGGFAVEKLRSIIERYENVEAEIKERKELQKDIKTEGKSLGIPWKVIAEAIRRRQEEPSETEEFDNWLDLVLRALGMKRPGPVE